MTVSEDHGVRVAAGRRDVRIEPQSRRDLGSIWRRGWGEDRLGRPDGDGGDA
jgi:hypothetical protein